MWAREADAVKLSREVKGIILKIEIEEDEGLLMLSLLSSRRQIRTHSWLLVIARFLTDQFL